VAEFNGGLPVPRTPGAPRLASRAGGAAQLAHDWHVPLFLALPLG
jgi:hypothetical protein